jgi:hypothetical protein
MYLEKARNVYMANVQQADGTSENYMITADSVGAADAILSKYERQNRLLFVDTKIVEMKGKKAQINRRRLYSDSDELLLEAPYIENGKVVRGYNWRDY